MSQYLPGGSLGFGSASPLGWLGLWPVCPFLFVPLCCGLFFLFSWRLRSLACLSLLPGALALLSCWLLHSLFYVVVEAFTQLFVDCLLDSLAGSAVNHLRHGQGTHCLDTRAALSGAHVWK